MSASMQLYHFSSVPFAAIEVGEKPFAVVLTGHGLLPGVCVLCIQLRGRFCSEQRSLASGLSRRYGSSPSRKTVLPLTLPLSGPHWFLFSFSLESMNIGNVLFFAGDTSSQAACLAQDVAALKKLRASIRVSIADASEPPSSSQEPGHLSGGQAADACVQTLRRGISDSSRVFLVSGGGVSVWQRRDGGRSRHSRRGGDGDDSDEEGGTSPPFSVVSMGVCACLCL